MQLSNTSTSDGSASGGIPSTTNTNCQPLSGKNLATNREIITLGPLHEPAPSRPFTVPVVTNMEGHARRDAVNHAQNSAVSSHQRPDDDGKQSESALERSPKRPRLDENDEFKSQPPFQKHEHSYQPVNHSQALLQRPSFATQPFVGPQSRPVADSQPPLPKLQSREPPPQLVHQSLAPVERVGLPVGTMAYSWEFPPVRASHSRPPLCRENSETRRRTWTLSRTKRASSLNLNNHPNNAHPVGIAIWIVQKIDQARKAKTMDDTTPRATSPPRSPGAGPEPWQQFDPAFLEERQGPGSQEAHSPNTPALIGQQPIWGNTIPMNHEDTSDRRQAQRNRKKKQREENWAKNKETDVIARAKAEARKDPNITTNEHFEAEVRRRSTSDFDRLLTRQVHAFAADLAPLRPFQCGFASKAVYRGVDDTMVREGEPTIVEQETQDKNKDNATKQDSFQEDPLEARTIALRHILNLLPVLSSGTSASFQEAADVLVRALHSPENIPGHDAFFVAIEALGTREDVQQGIDGVLNRLHTLRPDDRRTARHRTHGPATPALSGISPSPMTTTSRDLNWRTPITPTQNNFAPPPQSHYQQIQANPPSNVYQPLGRQIPFLGGSVEMPFPTNFLQQPAPYHPFPPFTHPPPLIPYAQSNPDTTKGTAVSQPSSALQPLPPLSVPAPVSISVDAKETTDSQSSPMLQTSLLAPGSYSQGSPVAAETGGHQSSPILQPSPPLSEPIPQRISVTAKETADSQSSPMSQPSPPLRIRSSSRERKPSHKLQAASVERPSRVTRQTRSPSPLPTPKTTKSAPKVPSKLGMYQIVADQAPALIEGTNRARDTSAIASTPKGSENAGSVVNHEKIQDVPVHGTNALQTYETSQPRLAQQGLKPFPPHLQGPPLGTPSLPHEEGPHLHPSSVLVAAAKFALEASDSDDDEDLSLFPTQRSPSTGQQKNQTGMSPTLARQSRDPTTSRQFTALHSRAVVKSPSQPAKEAQTNPTLLLPEPKELVAAAPQPPKRVETTEESPVIDSKEVAAISLQASAMQPPAKDISRPSTSSSDRTNVYSHSSHDEPRLNSIMSARDARELSESWKREDIENRGRKIRGRSSASVSPHISLHREPLQNIVGYTEQNSGRGGKEHPAQPNSVTRKRRRSPSTEGITKSQKAQKIQSVGESAGEAEVMLRLKRMFEDRGMLWVDSLNYDIASDMLDAHDKKRGAGEMSRNNDHPVSVDSYHERSNASTSSPTIPYVNLPANGQKPPKWQLHWPGNSHSLAHGQVNGHVPNLLPKYSYTPAKRQTNGHPTRPASSNSQPRSFGFTPINTDISRYNTAPPSPASPANSAHPSPNDIPTNPFASLVAAPNGHRYTNLRPLSPKITSGSSSQSHSPNYYPPMYHAPQPHTEPALNGGHPGGGLIINAPKRREQKGARRGNNSSSITSGGAQNTFVARNNGVASSSVELNTPKRGGHLVNFW